MLPSLGEVLEMPAVCGGRPEVVAGAESLSRPVRWVHVSELEDIAELLQGGELILTTGIALSRADDELRRYVDALAGAGASGLIIELGRRFKEVPTVLVRACSRRGLPLIVLHRPVPFVRLTEAIHSRIIQEQLETVRISDRAHNVFTALSVKGAGIAEIVSEVGRMTAAPIVFEDLLHRVVAFDPAGLSTDDLLDRWESRSRAAQSSEPTAVCGPEGWVVTSVEIHGETFGRLILIPAGDANDGQKMILERGATALTLNRLLERNRETLERQSHRSILTDIVEGRYATEREIHSRAASLGVPIAKRAMLGLIIKQAREVRRSSSDRDGSQLLAAAVRAAGVSAVVGTLPDGQAGALIALGRPNERSVTVGRLADHVHTANRERGRMVIGIGSTVQSLDAVRRSFTEAAQVLAAAAASTIEKAYYELPDIRLRGLIYTLADDARLQAFVERSLSPLLEFDERQGADLSTVLGVFLEHGGNKSNAAAALRLSRQAFYDRLATIERVLAVDLSSAEVRTSLHAALMGLEAARAADSVPDSLAAPPEGGRPNPKRRG